MSGVMNCLVPFQRPKGSIGVVIMLKFKNAASSGVNSKSAGSRPIRKQTNGSSCDGLAKSEHALALFSF